MITLILSRDPDVECCCPHRSNSFISLDLLFSLLYLHQLISQSLDTVCIGYNELGRLSGRGNLYLSGFLAFSFLIPSLTLLRVTDSSPWLSLRVGLFFSVIVSPLSLVGRGDLHRYVSCLFISSLGSTPSAAARYLIVRGRASFWCPLSMR